MNQRDTPGQDKTSPFLVVFHCLTVTSSHWEARQIYNGKKREETKWERASSFPFLSPGGARIHPHCHMCNCATHGALSKMQSRVTVPLDTHTHLALPYRQAMVTMFTITLIPGPEANHHLSKPVLAAVKQKIFFYCKRDDLMQRGIAIT